MGIDAKQDIQSQFIPFIGNDFARGNFISGTSDKEDQFFQNGLFWAIENPQTGKQTFYFTARPGTTGVYSYTGSTSLGTYFWDNTTALYQWHDTILRKENSTIATVTGGGEVVTWAESQPSAPTKYLCLNIGSKLLVIDASNNVTVLSSVIVTTVAVGNPSTVTTSTAHGLTTGVRVVLRGVSGATPNVNGTPYTITVTGPTTFTIPVNVTVQGTGGTLGNFPATTGSIQYMNGYFFVITTAGQIYNCEFNDPLNWDTTKFLTAQMYPSAWSSLARQNNFLLAFSEQSVQAFVDDANATGSPLTNYESGVSQVGCKDPRSIVTNGSQITWVGYTQTGDRSVYVMDGLGNPQDIGTIQIRKWLTECGGAIGLFLKVAGKTLYLLSAKFDGSVNRFMWVYDYEVKLWCRWVFGTSGSFSSLIVAGTEGTPTVYGEPTNFLMLFDGTILYLRAVLTTDYDGSYAMVAQTQPIDFGTQRRKFVRRLELVADRQRVGGVPQDQDVYVQYSDNDGETFTTLSTNMMIDTTSTRMMLPLGGNFRRRVYRFTWNASSSGLTQRWMGIELYFRFGDA